MVGKQIILVLNSCFFRPNGGWTKRRERSNQNSKSGGGREDAEQQEISNGLHLIMS
jgi:hypothetical protein